MTDPTNSLPDDRSTSVAPARGFDELEQQLRDLRRALGEDVGLDPEPRTVLEQPSAPTVATHAAPEAGPEGEGPEVSREVSDQQYDLLLDDSPEYSDEQSSEQSSEQSYERPSRGVGLDLVLLAGAWAGLIVLVVVVLGRAS